MISPLNIPNLVAFWNFQEEPGQDRVCAGTPTLSLAGKRRKNPARKRTGCSGLTPPASATARGFACRGKTWAELNICGPAAQVTVVAWIKRRPFRLRRLPGGCRHLERTRATPVLPVPEPAYSRQPRTSRRPLSAIGGATPGPSSIACDAAIGATPGPRSMPGNAWPFSYDGTHMRRVV